MVIRTKLIILMIFCIAICPQKLGLLIKLGLDISQKKLNPPSTEVICLGIVFNIVKRTITIHHDKLSEIVRLCEQWR